MKSGSYMSLVIIYVFSHSIAFGQARNLTYRLEGRVNRDSGTVTLLPSGEGFDPNLNNNYETKIRQGRFLLEGKMAYPTSYRIQMRPGYISNYFLLEPGTQTIICHIDSLREMPQLMTKTMTEYYQFIADYVSPINNQRDQAVDQYMGQKSATTNLRTLDSLQTAFSQKRARLIHQQQLGYLTYITQHPTSYVGLWQVVRDLGEGYRPILDSLYRALSSSLKNTLTGKRLSQRLSSSKVTAVGQSFPSLNLLDIGNKSVSLSLDHKSKYTLVDFWFSHCGPCLQQFPKLKELFSTYQAKGFTIVGISTDKSNEIEIWKKTIQAHELIWPQYVDLSGKLSASLLSINYFPSNFLLDEKGVILRRDISPQELSTFLSGRL